MTVYNKIAVRVLCGICAGSILFGTCSYRAYADTASLKASIKQKQEEIDEAQKKKKELQTGLTQVKEIMKGLQTERSNLQNYVAKLDDNLSEVEAKIEELKTLISEKEDEILKTTEELEDAVEKEETQYQSMKDRIQFLYEKGDAYYLELLLSAESFGEFVNTQEYITKLSEYDNNMLEEYVTNRELIEVCKAELEAEEELLEEAKAKVDEEQKNLETLIASKEQEINKYTGDIKNKEQAIAEYEADIAMENDTIAALEAALAEERRKLLEANGSERIIYDGGMFKWPAPSYTRISDEFGWRIHPTLGIKKFHNGMDMAAPGGSPILAAYDGEVIGAGYNSSMGNYIMINHGGGLITIYMHASALYVSTGEMVGRGEKIAAVGTTGRSTGNHLHFGVRLNGEYVNPWNYLSQ